MSDPPKKKQKKSSSRRSRRSGSTSQQPQPPQPVVEQFVQQLFQQPFQQPIQQPTQQPIQQAGQPRHGFDPHLAMQRIRHASEHSQANAPFRAGATSEGVQVPFVYQPPNQGGNYTSSGSMAPQQGSNVPLEPPSYDQGSADRGRSVKRAFPGTFYGSRPLADQYQYNTESAAGNQQYQQSAPATTSSQSLRALST